jgi:predicted nucleotidyltransferase
MERKIIYQVESGSFLYGTNTENSDKDYISVFIPTNYDLLSLQKCEFINDSTKNSSEDRRNTKDDVDNQSYSISNYLHLVLNSNPNLTEILFCDKPIIETSDFTLFKSNTDKLISKKVYNSFTGFAISQKKKLEYKSTRYTQLERAIEYLEIEYSGSIRNNKAKMPIELADWLNNNLSEYKGDRNNTKSFHINLPVKEIYEKIKQEYEKYGWRTKTDTFASLGYDVKFASHTIRLFYECMQLLTTGRLAFPITGQAYDDIMAVKRGKVSIEQFYELCEYYEGINHKAFENTVLPDKADYKWVNEKLVDMLEQSVSLEAMMKKTKVVNP